VRIAAATFRAGGRIRYGLDDAAAEPRRQHEDASRSVAV